MDLRKFATSVLHREFLCSDDKATKLERVVFNYTYDFIETICHDQTSFRYYYNIFTQILIDMKDFANARIDANVQPSSLMVLVMDAAYKDRFVKGIIDTNDPRAAQRIFVKRKLRDLLPEEFADRVEDALALVQTTAASYRKQAASVLFNLGHQRTGLRLRVLSGGIPCSSLARACKKDFWPELWSQACMQPGRKIIITEASDEVTRNTETMLQCFGCKKFTVETVQLQTRSADEGMTVFCNCLTCGKRWKV